MIGNVKIIGTGAYLPPNKVSSEDLDLRLGKEKGVCEKLTQIRTRYYVDETHSTSKMAAIAARKALEAAGLQPCDLECIIVTNSIPQQPIPSTASFVQVELGLGDSGIPAFDVNSTCLSHLTALDFVSPHILTQRYKNVLVVSSETASRGLNYEQLESSILMGDGAAATIISLDQTGESFFINSLMQTFGSGAHYAEFRGGGSNLHPREMKGKDDPNFAFHMEGRKIFKLSSKKVPSFLDKFFSKLDDTINDVDLIIPHQASYQSLKLMERKLGLKSGSFYNIVRDYGNQVSASMPFALNHAIESGRLNRGDKVLLIGTGAGLSIGALYFKY